MAKEVICVYQDCPMCGSRGNELKKTLVAKGVQLRKVSFASEEGKELISQALGEYKIGTMPFYVYEERFSVDINDVLEEKPVEKSIKKQTKKGRKNGADK